MTDATVAIAKARRHWLTPHASSIVAGLFIAMAIVLWNTAGRLSASSDWQFGWPWTFAEATPDWRTMQGGMMMNAFSNVEYDWRKGFIWNNWENLDETKPLLAVIDAALAVFLSMSGVVTFEAWRRQRRGLWQIHLRELMLLCAGIAAMLGFGTKMARTTRENAAGIARLKSHSSKGGGYCTERVLPEAVRVWLPGAEIKPLDRLVLASEGNLAGYDDQDLHFLASQPHLRSLSLRASPGCVAPLESCPALASISFFNYQLGNEDFRGLARMKNLRCLHVYCPILPPEAVPACGEIVRLEELILGGRVFCFRTRDGELLDYHTSKLRGDVEGMEEIKADLSLFRRLQRLERLELSKLDIANGTLASIADLNRLNRFKMTSCKFDASDLAKLRKLRPNMTVDVHD